jgi:hypothetical protein
MLDSSVTLHWHSRRRKEVPFLGLRRRTGQHTQISPHILRTRSPRSPWTTRWPWTCWKPEMNSQTGLPSCEPDGRCKVGLLNKM